MSDLILDDVLALYSQTMAELIRMTEAYVTQYMSHYDSSHDYAHVQRVLSLAQHIAAAEPRQSLQSRSNPTPKYDPDVVTLAALLHDVGDRKYLPPGSSAADGARLAADFLVSINAPSQLAEKVQEIVNAVSYSSEIKDPSRVLDVLARHPELGPVQDADRLDAIGAVGLGRTFTYNAARGGKETGMGMGTAVEHIDEKLLKLEGMMKTKTGKQMAGVRTERLRMFREWWREEVGLGKKHKEAKVSGS